MATLTRPERREREALVRQMLADKKSTADIAEKLGITRQAAWEFCARRKWLPGDEEYGYAANLERKDERRRAQRHGDG